MTTLDVKYQEDVFILYTGVMVMITVEMEVMKKAVVS